VTLIDFAHPDLACLLFRIPLGGHAMGVSQSGPRMVAMNNTETNSQPEDEERIDANDEAAIARWAQQLCTSQRTLRQAIATVGAQVRDIKGYLFTKLVRDAARTNDR
jgi:hypothetical protein